MLLSVYLSQMAWQLMLVCHYKVTSIDASNLVFKTGLIPREI